MPFSASHCMLVHVSISHWFAHSCPALILRCLHVQSLAEAEVLWIMSVAASSLQWNTDICFHWFVDNNKHRNMVFIQNDVVATVIYFSTVQQQLSQQPPFRIITIILSILFWIQVMLNDVIHLQMSQVYLFSLGAPKHEGLYQLLAALTHTWLMAFSPELPAS